MKKKVLFIIWSFTAGGGAERILSNIVNKLDSNKFDISVLEFIQFDIRKEYTNEHVKLLTPALVQPKYSDNKILNLVKKIKWIIKSNLCNYIVHYFPSILRKLLIKEKYDIEVAFNYQIPTFLVSAAKENVRKFCWVHGSIEDLDYTTIDNRISKYKVKSLYKLQDKSFNSMEKIISISNQTFDSIIKLYPQYESKTIKVYNGYNFSNIIAMANESIDILKTSPTIVGIGRLDYLKNFQLLIKAAKVLKGKNIDFKLYILGEGELKDNLVSLIDEYKLNDIVILTGYLNNPYPYIKIADLFCLTSIAEGFPTVIVESMALGCPFVSTKVAGIEELSSNGECGLVVESDEYIIADSIKSIIENKQLRAELSSNCINRVKEFTLERQIDEIERMFDNKQIQNNA